MILKNRAWMAFLALGVMILVAGCGGGDDDDFDGGWGSVDRFESQIINAYARLADNLEDENLDRLLDQVSLDYLQDGTDFDGFAFLFEAFFEDYNSIDVTIDIDRIEFNNRNAPTLARVFFYQRITGIYVPTGVREVVEGAEGNVRVQMIWRWEDGRWRMLGNQFSSPAILSATPKSPARLLGKPVTAGEVTPGFPTQ